MSDTDFIYEQTEYEGIILTTTLRSKIKEFLLTRTYYSPDEVMNDIQRWLRDNNKHIPDGYIFQHTQAMQMDAEVMAIPWEFPEESIRCFITDESIVNLLSNPDYDDLAVYINTMQIPWVKRGNGRWLYFGYVLPEHYQLLEAFGGQFETKQTS